MNRFTGSFMQECYEAGLFGQGYKSALYYRRSGYSDSQAISIVGGKIGLNLYTLKHDCVEKGICSDTEYKDVLKFRKICNDLPDEYVVDAYIKIRDVLMNYRNKSWGYYKDGKGLDLKMYEEVKKIHQKCPEMTDEMIIIKIKNGEQAKVD